MSHAQANAALINPSLLVRSKKEAGYAVKIKPGGFQVPTDLLEKIHSEAHIATKAPA